ncbi:MAG: DnaD domain-containing protein [Bacilli bacterium]
MPTEILNKVIKEKTYNVPSFILKNYEKLNLTAEEVLVLIVLYNHYGKISYDINKLLEEINLEKYKLMQLISSLEEKKIISIDLITNSKGLKEEYISLELLYDKIVNIYLDVKEETNESADIYSAFEKELGRTLSPMEYEIIKGWVMDKFSDELIILALKEAVYNGVNNLRYIDKVLYGWRKKNIKNKQDIIKDKEKFKNRQKENVEVFDYNWLDE